MSDKDEIEKWQRVRKWAEDNGRPARKRQAETKLEELGALEEDPAQEPEPEPAAPEPEPDPTPEVSDPVRESHREAEQIAAEVEAKQKQEEPTVNQLVQSDPEPSNPLDELEFPTRSELGYETKDLAMLVDEDVHEVQTYVAYCKRGTPTYPEPFHIAGPQHSFQPPEWIQMVVEALDDERWEIHSQKMGDYAYVGRVILDEFPNHAGAYGLTFTASCDSSMAQRMLGTVYIESQGVLVPFTTTAFPGSYKKYTKDDKFQPEKLKGEVSELSDQLEQMAPKMKEFQQEKTTDHPIVLETLLSGKLPNNQLPDYIDKDGEGILETLVPEYLWDVFVHCTENVWQSDLERESTRHTYWKHIHEAFEPVDTYLALMGA